MEEKVTQLQKELDRTQTDLQTARQAVNVANEELTRLKANAPSVKPETRAAPSVAPTLPARKELEDAYMASAKELKKALQGPLKNFTIDSFTLHNVQLPDSQFPFASSISLSMKSSDGKSYELDFPVKADAKGKWVFPDPAEIALRVAEAIKKPQPRRQLRNLPRAAHLRQNKRPVRQRQCRQTARLLFSGPIAQLPRKTPSVPRPQPNQLRRLGHAHRKPPRRQISNKRFQPTEMFSFASSLSALISRGRH